MLVIRRHCPDVSRTLEERLGPDWLLSPLDRGPPRHARLRFGIKSLRTASYCECEYAAMLLGLVVLDPNVAPPLPDQPLLSDGGRILHISKCIPTCISPTVGDRPVIVCQQSRLYTCVGKSSNKTLATHLQTLVACALLNLSVATQEQGGFECRLP